MLESAPMAKAVTGDVELRAPPSPLSVEERTRIIERPRPVRALPVVDTAASPRRYLPLAEAPASERIEPLVAIWELTLRCDLACRHCGSRAGHARPNELSTDECVDLVRQLAELGTKEVALIGGEAYLRDDWTTIVRSIKQHGMLPTMTTGGRGMTAERARAAADAGLFSASVSVDGERESHDRLRGVDGSWEAAYNALRELHDAGVHVAVNTQLNRLTMTELPQMLPRLAAANARSWQLQLTVAMGRAVDEPDVLLQPYDVLEVHPMLAALVPAAKAHKINVVPGNNIGYFGPHERILRGATALTHRGSCGAGQVTIGIEADGAIKGCPSLSTDTWAGGNVRESSLADIWSRAAALRYTRDRTVKDLWGYCATCYYADECRAGCTWTADVLFGRPGNNPYCHHRALELKKANLRERLVRVDEAPGLPFDRGRFELVVEPWPGG
jgi:radical SAM protein with 4Fe4S-binding SPASM domain